jgi:hypothetical protein
MAGNRASKGWTREIRFRSEPQVDASEFAPIRPESVAALAAAAWTESGLGAVLAFQARLQLRDAVHPLLEPADDRLCRGAPHDGR